MVLRTATSRQCNCPQWTGCAMANSNGSKTNGHTDNFTDGINEALRRLAAISLANGTASDQQRRLALIEAQRAGITTSQYLKARLLLSASMSTEFNDDGG